MSNPSKIRVPLGELCQVDRRVVRPSDSEFSDLPYVGLENVESQTGRILRPLGGGMKSAGFRFDKRHVLYGRLRPYLNKVAVPNFPGQCTSEIIPLLPRKGESRILLACALRQPAVVDFAVRNSAGARMPRINIERLLEFPVSVPDSPAERKRLGDSLSANLRRAEKMKAAMQAQAEAIAALPESILAKTFERGKFPRQWKKAQVGDIAVVNPPRPDLSARPPDAQTTFIPMEAVDGKMGAASPLVRPYAEVRTGYTFFREGDVLFAKMTSSLRNRKHFIARKTRDGLGFASTEFHVLRPGDAVLAEWLYFHLRQPLVAALAESNFYGSAQQRVSADFVRGLEIPLPPLSEQRIIARMLKAKMKVSAKLAAAARAQLDAASALPGAHLRRAFSGR